MQRRQLRRLQRAWLGGRKLRRKVVQHLEIVRGLEGRRQHDGAATDLVDRIFEFGATIGGIDVDEHEAGLGGRMLRQQPFDIVLRPDGDTVALLESQPHQRAGDGVDAASQLGIGQAVVLMARDQGLARRMFRAGGVEIGADRLLDQRNVGCALVVAECGHGRSPNIAVVTWPPPRPCPAAREREGDA